MTTRQDDRPTNRLANETSPYLLQHAHNPVDWFPWSEEALDTARETDRPIFLSIGYAACHWCHVMERESFEDDDTAAFLNERFVSIKVDREERPDLDGIYMDAVQAMNRGHGGWPMSVFCTPEGEPFYAGTYFPKEPGRGMPSFRQVLEGIAELWRGRRDEALRAGQEVTRMLAGAAAIDASQDPLTEEIEREAFASLERAFDATWGGFGGSPKFPQPMTLEFCLRMGLRGTPGALEMVTVTLNHMADGGIHDQLGGGFSRYSVDRAWHVPHFEKMLYDNAQLAQLYTRAWQVTRNDRYRDVASGTLHYLVREMQHPGGGFWSSQDADSEGVEGKFFAWPWDELVALVGEVVATAFGASPQGNWEGTNVLWHPVPIDAVAAEFDLETAQLHARVDAAASLLFQEREKRVRPATDDKILTAWNALAIRAFAEAGRVFDEPAFIEAAVRCAGFVWVRLRGDDGRLLRSWRDGVAGGPAFADDHALLASAFLTLFETTADVSWFVAARYLGDELLRLFHDEERGGFFQTGEDAERLVVRPKELYDNAVPGANSAAAEALLRLGLFTGEPRYERAAVSAISLVRDAIATAPSGFGHALGALDLYLGPSREVAILGPPGDAATRALADEVVKTRFLPNAVMAIAAPDDVAAAEAVPLLRDRATRDGIPTAYVCEGFTCRLPVTTPRELADQLEK